VFLVLCLRGLWTHGGWRRPETIGFLAIAGLCVLGFVLGALIQGSNTMVPAHYHASIGAVTAAFMTVTYVLLAPLGLRLPEGRLGRWAAWQPALFGVGQMVFAVGFGMAGAAGAARKAYGSEQAIRSTQEWVGLFVMGVGGLVAVAGGILFLTILAVAWRHRLTGALPRRKAWRKTLEPSTPFRS
jgi:heme/copper-type cytochrome/quinol oxidase subunit 1